MGLIELRVSIGRTQTIDMSQGNRVNARADNSLPAVARPAAARKERTLLLESAHAWRVGNRFRLAISRLAVRSCVAQARQR